MLSLTDDRKEIPIKKQTIQYTSPLDALIAVAKRLSTYENQQQMDSEEFFDQYSRGQLADDALFVDWANDYRHYLQLRQKLAESLPDVAVIPSNSQLRKMCERPTRI